jgi:hypothetical protein
MMPRRGDVAVTMLANVQQATIAPFIKVTITLGAGIFTDATDAYDIYARASMGLDAQDGWL